MVSRRPRSDAVPVPERPAPPRAKRLRPLEATTQHEAAATSAEAVPPAVKGTWEAFREASLDFDMTVEDRSVVSRVDARYVALARSAASFLHAVLREPTLQGRLDPALDAYVAGGRRPGEDAEDDLKLARRTSEWLARMSPDDEEA